ncbi:MAG: ribonuclease J [Halocynthiibacter sp.]
MAERLIYLPLGGAGEIGMNAYVYGYGPKGKERLILVDLGVTFPDMDGTPGVDLIMPDISWLKDNKNRLEAIFITHAHEDHVGAVGHLWRDLGAPIYARPFTANHARHKMADQGQPEEEVRIVNAHPETVKAGPLTVSFMPVSHSIPESSGLVIDTPAGRVVHTGDFKLDENPVIGDPFDPELWAEIAKPGVKALVCDSTNVFSTKDGRSESEVKTPITDLVKGAPGMVVATTFASNVARLQSLAEAGEAAGRSVCLLGRSMRRMMAAGLESGVITKFPKTISAEEAADIPRENLMLIVTGSQGERRAASAQLSRGKYLGLSMKEGDMFLFSSKTIPGNERGVIRIMNAYAEMGVDVVDDHDGLYHVSGHANGPDIQRVHDLMDPEMVIPMHGEYRHLRQQARMAMNKGRGSVIAVNGTMLDITGAAPEAVEFIETGRTYLDGSVKFGAFDGIIRDRIRLALNGIVTVSVILDEEDEPLGEPWVEAKGLAEVGKSNASVIEIAEEDLNQFLMRAKPKTLRDDAVLEEELKRITRKVFRDEIGKKPEVSITISRLS